MDIIENNIYEDINGYIVSDLNYLDKAKIYRVYTDKFGLISVYVKSNDIYLSFFSNYSFRLKYSGDLFVLLGVELNNFLKFINKKHILLLNIISEIITKTTLQFSENKELYLLISKIINSEQDMDIRIKICFFIHNYLECNGYFFINNVHYLSDIIVDIVDLEIKNDITNYLSKYQFRLTKEEYSQLILFIINKDINSFFSMDISNIDRILGILLNSLCVNFNIHKLESYKLL